MRLDPLFRPESIAVIGASDKPTPGRRIIASLERIGFAGRIFPVNPNYPSVLNRPCYASPAELPEEPDIAVFCLGHERVFSAFEAAAKRGMKAAVIYDGGFAEQGAEGRALQARIAAICVEAGIALCGPNCMGILNPHHKSTTYLQELREPAGLAGNVAILSHSGGLCVGLLTDTRRFGFSHIVSSGNEATVSAAAFLEYLLEDPHTAIVGGFIEAIREPERFAAALDRAAALGKPVVMVKVGRHERTRRAITTHTGGDADDSAAVSALLRAHGAIEVADIEGAARLGDQQSVVHFLPCTRISVSPRREDSLVRPHWLPRTSAGATRNRNRARADFRGPSRCASHRRNRRHR